MERAISEWCIYFSLRLLQLHHTGAAWRTLQHAIKHSIVPREQPCTMPGNDLTSGHARGGALHHGSCGHLHGNAHSCDKNGKDGTHSHHMAGRGQLQQRRKKGPDISSVPTTTILLCS